LHTAALGRRLLLIPVDPSQRKPNEPEPRDDAEDAAERRRIGRVVHDDRGTARVEWEYAPADFDRPKLEIETFDDTVHRLAILKEGAAEPSNPYNRPPAAPRRPPQPAPKRDLRKLSEWIKMMRGLEARKERGEDDDENEAG
jgi:hypothetical protein